ncbi:hypothetical protein Misp06_00976 [Microbulbifer sp. NBRC 101763]
MDIKAFLIANKATKTTQVSEETLEILSFFEADILDGDQEYREEPELSMLTAGPLGYFNFCNLFILFR